MGSKVHALLSAAYIAGHLALDAAGLPFELSIDWMWMADAGDLRDRLVETLYYYGAFAPGMNLATGLLLKVSEANAVVLAHAWFWALGLVFVNAVFFVARASGLSTRAAAILALAFSFAPPSIYFGHLYHYEWVVTTLLCGIAALFYQGVRRPTTRVWLACFLACVLVALTRTTFHPGWYVLMVTLAAWSVQKQARRLVAVAAVAPAILLFGVCLKNFLLFDDFAVATYGPSSVTLSTVAHLPYDIRDRWIESGELSPFAAMNVYAPPRDYAKFFGSPEHPRWPPQLTRLEHASAEAPNYNHWWLLEVQRARRSDVFHYLRTLPLDYLSNVAGNLVEMTGPTTRWHPRDATRTSPHRRHRWLLGGYETWFNSAFHGFPAAPVGLYLFLPIPLAWACMRAWRDSNSPERDTQARGALFALMVFLIVYVFAASTLLTSLEMARYRYQIEAFIWIVSCAFVSEGGRGRKGGKRQRGDVEKKKMKDPLLSLVWFFTVMAMEPPFESRIWLPMASGGPSAVRRPLTSMRAVLPDGTYTFPTARVPAVDGGTSPLSAASVYSRRGSASTGFPSARISKVQAVALGEPSWTT